MSSNLSDLFNNAKKVTLVSYRPKELPKVEVKPEDVDEEQEEDDDDGDGETTKKVKKSHDHDSTTIANAQTIFVGNVPSDCTQKELKRLFSEFGKVESVRLRNLIPLHPSQGKRLAFIKKELHPLQRTITAYIRFEDKIEAETATSLNGHLYKEHHLRVNMAHEQHEEVRHDNHRSIFIGNLPFDANDDDVWQAFQECGEVENVRLIRDRATSVGKGFGYVLFQDEASVALALRLNGNCRIGNREIRIKTAVRKPKAGRPNVAPRRQPGYSGRTQTETPSWSKDEPGVQQGRVGKRPALKLKKEKQMKKKRNSSVKTNSSRKDVLHMKKKS